MPKIFDPFNQATGVTKQFGGLGLGLAIAKAAVEGHGGEIRAESTGLNQGATFIIRLPLLQKKSDSCLEKDSQISLSLR